MPAKQTPHSPSLEDIKRLAIQALFLDDELEERLVLKGGAALALAHGLASRQSVDVDFSMEGDFDDQARAEARIQLALERMFKPRLLELLDFRMVRGPDPVSPDVAAFWGGYQVEFKLVPSDHFKAHVGDLQQLQRSAIRIGSSTRFLIDISPFEVVDAKVERDLDGVSIFVYTPLMIACEKLRAICQQQPEYGEIVHRRPRDTPRSRDFFDIVTLVETFDLKVTSDEGIAMLQAMFESKKVPVELLGRIGGYREMHRADFRGLAETVKAGADLQPFDYYFDRVVVIGEQALLALRVWPRN